jgi:NAD(P)-dependent dehydrogenase (short-subunit alcohol dehydrogenase family)
MRQRLQGKVAVITGAASGIGEATVELFVDQGCQVLAADKNAEPALPWPTAWARRCTSCPAT